MNGGDGGKRGNSGVGDGGWGSSGAGGHALCRLVIMPWDRIVALSIIPYFIPFTFMLSPS
jgi:hypothetical protein